MKIEIKILFLAIVVALLLISIKFFPYHCNSKACQARIASENSQGTAPQSATSTNLLIIDESYKVKEITTGGTSIKVLIADTLALQEKGLSGRVKLENNQGMLFVFTTPKKYAFWMKDMNFDLDMIWIDKDQKILGITKKVPSNSYPKIFNSPENTLYVLEVASGFTDLHNIKVGDFFSPTF